MQTTNTFNQYRLIMLDKLCRSQVPQPERTAMVEVIMILILSILYGLILYNPHQVARELGIPAKQLYRRLHSLSARAWRWRRLLLLERMMTQAALQRLQEYQTRSPATRARRQASLSIDDTVQKRLGKVLSYVWSWYSGQAQKTLAGQDLVGIVLCLNGEILPVRLVWVSKQGQGRGPTGKPALVLQIMKELKEEFAQAGVDLTALGVSLDSWWISHTFSAQLEGLGFDKQVICGKSHLILETEQSRQALGAHRKQIELKSGWGLGAQTSGATAEGEQSEVGAGGSHFLPAAADKGLCAVVSGAGRALRTYEALRLWENYHGVEVFWKRLKSWLGLGRMQLRGREGAWAELALRGLAYLLALALWGPHRRTLAQLRHWLHRQGTFIELVQEHFHPKGWGIA